jgi:hypothetical protein
MRSSFLPARVSGAPIATTVSTFFNFKMQYSAGEYTYATNQSWIGDLLEY